MKKIEILFGESPRRIGFVLLLSLFWVIFLWNFWEQGIYALGFNLAVWLLLVIIFFDKCIEQKSLFQRKNIFLLLPLILIALSYAIYENPFIKVVNILVFPVILTIAFNYANINNRETKSWDFSFFLRMVGRFLLPITKLNASSKALGQISRIKTSGKGDVVRRIGLGLTIFIALAVIFVVPLLSSVDSLFEDKVVGVFDFIKNIASLEIVLKIITFYIIALILYAIFLAWSKPLKIKDSSHDKNKIDSIIAGIVVGGILLLYLLFIWIQFERIWVSRLPIEFKDVEVLVKSGFWQMMTLSIINVVIFFFTYKRTNKLVQSILSIFTVASLLLVASSAFRMFLYVTIYGLSYEKFFASYTILFCIILFVYLFVKVLSRTRLDILKFLVFLFIWMYALISIAPIEQFILRSNIKLSQNFGSRINLFESSILSADVLSYVEKNADEDFMSFNNKSGDVIDWSSWLEENRNRVENKKWHEMNLTNLLYFLNR